MTEEIPKDLTGSLHNFFGDFIHEGHMHGSIIITRQQEISAYKALSERVRDTFDVIELDYGEQIEKFIEVKSYRINPQTKEIEFNFDYSFDPNQYKVFKQNELKNKCQEEIQSGFTASNGHKYRTNTDDQLNFLGKFNQITSFSTIVTVMWKTEDEGYLEHIREEWLNVYSEALIQV